MNIDTSVAQPDPPSPDAPESQRPGRDRCLPDLFGRLRYPIVQAPIGSASSMALATAVCEAGGMGTLALTWTEPGRAREQVGALRRATDAPFAVNFVLSFRARSLPAALEAGAPVVTFSWGMPVGHMPMCRAAEAVVGIQVGSAGGALAALDLGADFLICQGIEAGGHVQSTTPLDELLPSVVELADRVPVVAAGGIVDASDVSRCLGLGASAVMLGTRFVATVESRAHEAYKRAIVEAGEHDTSMTWCYDGGWPYSGHRVLRNSTLERWEAAGCPLPGSRPGEHDDVATTAGGKPVRRYSMASPVEQTSGNVDDMALYAGAGAGRIGSVLSVSEVIESLFQDTVRSAALECA